MIPLLLTLALQTPSPTAEARALIDQGEVEAAIASLEALTGALPLEETVRRYEALGIAYALVAEEGSGDERAVRAYAKLLSIEPYHTLPYTLSPKATFPFERARKEAQNRAATTLRMGHPEVGVFDEVTSIDIELTSDPERWVSAVELCHRVQGTANPTCERRAAPAVGNHEIFEVPAVPARDDGGVLLLLSLSAFDQHGQEIYRARPLELPVGFAPPTAWYSNPWIWVGVGVAATIGTGVALAAVQPQNDQLRVVVPE
jgi:hypothetical protein